MTQHHDQVLGLGRNSAAEEIKTKYRALVLELHPDKNPQDQKAATAKFQEVRYYTPQQSLLHPYNAKLPLYRSKVPTKL
ncbi:hypothetical protein DL98DRAFT_421905 [Cadophora sp. DSE1049]|nr:hypothetical protein DL98DRAFT_421905 [Cadophora sp. DSE1049]